MSAALDDVAVNRLAGSSAGKLDGRAFNSMPISNRGHLIVKPVVPQLRTAASKSRVDRNGCGRVQVKSDIMDGQKVCAVDLANTDAV